MPSLILGEDFTSLGYVAPTVYLLKGGSVPNWRYYGSLTQAAAAYIDPGPVTPTGIIYFTSNGQPQTFGINVDFYTLINGKWTYTDYGYMKANPSASGVIRFYSTQGAGPYYAVLNRTYFGMSATVLSNYPADKIAALDSFYREAALLKYRYNALVGFLNTLSKKVLTPQEQQIFNEGLLKLQDMNNKLQTIEGLEIQYTAEGAIGLPIILIIAIIAIIAAATAWSIDSILTEKEKTKRINDSFELMRWVADKKTEVAAMVTAGTITQTQAGGIYQTLDSAAAIGNKIAVQSSAPKQSIFAEVGTFVKWGVIGFLAWQGIKLLKPSRNG